MSSHALADSAGAVTNASAAPEKGPRDTPADVIAVILLVIMLLVYLFAGTRALLQRSERRRASAGVPAASPRDNEPRATENPSRRSRRPLGAR